MTTIRHRAPAAVDERTPLVGLRAVAIFEALKGALVLAAALGMLSLLHKDLGEAAEHFVQRFHLSPEGHIAHAFFRAADQMTDARLWAIAAGAAIYALVRFVEAYGLWHARVWAEWFALLSGSLYLPWEIYELLVHPTRFRWSVFAINVAIVLYMLYVRGRASYRLTAE